MITFLNIAQLVLFIAVLALMGQGVLYVLAGGKRDANVIYQLFQVLNKPWIKGARFMAPRQISDERVPFVAFFVVAVFYAAVTLAKIEHCVSVAMQGCR